MRPVLAFLCLALSLAILSPQSVGQERPAWFSHVRSELPVDPTLEGFAALRRWRSSLARLVGTKSPGAEAGLWVREDDKGTIEVRLRLEPPSLFHS